jgi:toxin YoeB
MNKTVRFEKGAYDDFCRWAVHNTSIYEKIIGLINEIQQTPFKGKDKPEPLRYGHSGYWSRRITYEHRLIYKVTADAIIVVSCRGHY